MDVFIDEAGYTGSDLISADQPIFILASTIIEAREARALLDSYFEKPQPEVKFARRVRSARGRKETLEFLRALEVSRSKMAFFVFHKQYLLLTMLIDYWLEPMMHEDCINLYERGANIGLANLCYLTLGTCIGVAARRELLRRFQVMTRDRTRFAFHNFWDSLREAMRQHELVDRAFGALPLAEVRLGYDHLSDLPVHMLDSSDLGLLQTVEHWRQQLPDTEFVLYHDRSTMLERQRQFWKAILDPTNPPGVAGQDRRTIEFPLPVRELRLVDSRQTPQLQVADIIAGSGRTVWHARLAESSDPFCDALIDAGILNGMAGGVVPTAQVSPEDLETEGPVIGDTAEFIARLVESHKKK